MPIRFIGTQFNRREHSVHNGISSMESIIKRPNSDKIFYTAYTQISESFEKVKITQSIRPIDQAYKASELESVNDRIRVIIKAEIAKMNISVNALSKMIPMPQSSLNGFLLGTKGIKQIHLMNLQQTLNINILTV